MSTINPTNQPLRSLTLAPLLALIVFSLFATPALAARGHVRSSLPAFGGVCLSTPCEGALEEPSGIAVNDATGDLYVVDRGANRVVRYNDEGKYEGEINGSGLGGEGTAAGGGVQEDEEPTGEVEKPESSAID